MNYKVRIDISVVTEDRVVNSSVQENYETEDSSLERLAQLIADAIPKHEFPMFDVIELYRDGKPVGHGEV